jgi:hypothetical protein
VTQSLDQDSADLSVADEQLLLRELTKQVRAGGMKLTGEAAC